MKKQRGSRRTPWSTASPEITEGQESLLCQFLVDSRLREGCRCDTPKCRQDDEEWKYPFTNNRPEDVGEKVSSDDHTRCRKRAFLYGAKVRNIDEDICS